MADAEAVTEGVPRVDGVSYAGLVLNPRGLDRALATGVDEVDVVVVSTDEISIADTIGVGVPAQVRTLLEGAREIAPNIPLRCHFHNTRNTGYANAMTALDHGVSALDASTGGFGGCPFAPAATGNIATEDLLYRLDRTGIPTGTEMSTVTETAAWLAERLDNPVQALLGRAGPFPA